MKRILPLFTVTLFCTSVLWAKNPSKTVDFSGRWALDFAQTKNPPPGLQTYNMAVAQDGKQLKVETTLKAERVSEVNSDDRYPGGGNGGGYPGGGYPWRRGGGIGIGGGMGRVGFPMPGVGGGMGMPGRRGGGPRPAPRPRSTMAAYRLYPQSVVYNLDGTESKANLRDPDSTEVASKANWAKGGTLKTSLVGNSDSGRKSGKIQVKDKWKLSEDSQVLTVDRTIKSPGGSNTVHLFFHKQAAESAEKGE